jgi:hypothetical protein
MEVYAVLNVYCTVRIVRTFNVRLSITPLSVTEPLENIKTNVSEMDLTNSSVSQ